MQYSGDLRDVGADLLWTMTQYGVGQVGALNNPRIDTKHTIDNLLLCVQICNIKPVFLGHIFS